MWCAESASRLSPNCCEDLKKAWGPRLSGALLSAKPQPTRVLRDWTREVNWMQWRSCKSVRKLNGYQLNTRDRGGARSKPAVLALIVMSVRLPREGSERLENKS